MALTTRQKLVLGLIGGGVGVYAYYRFYQANPFLAGLCLGAGGVIFGPAFYDWAIEAGRRVPRPVMPYPR